MYTAQSRLRTLSRPKLLVRAARIGLGDYNRDRTLRRVMQGETVPPPGKAFDALWDQESAINDDRREGQAGYSPARHVELLAALINEARLADIRLA